MSNSNALEQRRARKLPGPDIPFTSCTPRRMAPSNLQRQQGVVLKQEEYKNTPSKHITDTAETRQVAAEAPGKYPGTLISKHYAPSL